MNVPEQIRISVGAFSGKRVGYALAFLSLTLVPAHFYISCEASDAVAGTSLIFFLLTVVLSFLVPRGTPHRFRPPALAFLAVIAHGFCAH
ncbi:hypothetical protein Cflav_PD2066 [Pedosphaera parvula Ellin514]|uniref:Uncharacterized protein n=1 Tax=Pedosphaera parvula (strain Ellin514) TaxID=320771 RepID=B9XMH5_PEDPL|nr:hypothetical protein Cflav_PD2066 [Pedosphaera parvula Ellin514]